MKNTNQLAIGQKINHWTILSEVKVEKGRNRRYWCKCDCGLEKEVIAKHLISGASSKCRKCTFAGSQSPLFGGYGEISSKKWKKLQKDAASRSLEFSITIEQAWQQFVDQDGKCALTGLEIIHPTSKGGTASLDRIDSKLGYVLGNIQWVHKTINRMKVDLNEIDFIHFCKLVVQNKLGI